MQSSKIDLSKNNDFAWRMNLNALGIKITSEKIYGYKSIYRQEKETYKEINYFIYLKIKKKPRMYIYIISEEVIVCPSHTACNYTYADVIDRRVLCACCT